MTKYGHYCYDWDEMYITEDDVEFECCSCYSGTDIDFEDEEEEDSEELEDDEVLVEF